MSSSDINRLSRAVLLSLLVLASKVLQWANNLGSHCLFLLLPSHSHSELQIITMAIDENAPGFRLARRAYISTTIAPSPVNVVVACSLLLTSQKQQQTKNSCLESKTSKRKLMMSVIIRRRKNITYVSFHPSRFSFFSFSSLALSLFLFLSHI